ncbi:uncharacterized protein BX663DRAFT_526320, partial [Cokeromyces recurvatus]|uniref:uncharacterized protein n=1 Tax=Cokeromyces recurvatus TaxID=90255 RepID=UPI002220B4E6
MYPANRQQQQQPIQSSQTQPLISHLSSVQHSSNDDMPPRKRTKKVRACDLCRRKKI